MSYSRSPENPALQLLQKSSKSASTTPHRPIWNSFATVGVRDFWENGCMLCMMSLSLDVFVVECLSNHAFVGSSRASSCCGFILRVTHQIITAQFAHTALAWPSKSRPRPPSFPSSPTVPVRYGAQAAAERAPGPSADQLHSARTRVTDRRWRHTPPA